MATQFDHGMLNTPLAKRQGNIDAQIDAYKAAQARADAISFKAGRREIREARALVRSVSLERMAELGKRHNLTAKQTQAQFLSMADSRPALVIKTMTAELAKSPA